MENFKPFTVSELNRDVQSLLDQTLPPIWVEGEISNFVSPASGHWYFPLKDATAQVRCAMFRNNNRQLDFFPENGQQILVHGKVGLYAPRGDYQLIVDAIEPAGDGALKRAFELLKKKLNQEGLFALEYKKPLPKLPQSIGVITSPTGAAVHDILRVLRRRFASIPVIIYPTQVQGEAAVAQIVAAIQLANAHQQCDVLLLARGGGSLEDLWCFNDERVARAVFNSQIPICSGVGHEVDVTIADFVADHRAATPSAAAELVSPDSVEWLQNFLTHEARLTHLINSQLQHWQLLIHQLQKRLKHPRQQLQEQTQKLDLLEQRLRQTWQIGFAKQQTKLDRLANQLIYFNPTQSIKHLKTDIQHHLQRLTQQIKNIISQAKQQLITTTRALDAISPLATLERGYAIITNPQHQIIKNTAQVDIGDEIHAKLAKGALLCEVKDYIPQG